MHEARSDYFALKTKLSQFLLLQGRLFVKRSWSQEHETKLTERVFLWLFFNPQRHLWCVKTGSTLRQMPCALCELYVSLIRVNLWLCRWKTLRLKLLVVHLSSRLKPVHDAKGLRERLHPVSTKNRRQGCVACLATAQN